MEGKVRFVKNQLLMTISLKNLVTQIYLTLSGASHADKSVVLNLSTSIDLTALTRQH